MKSLLIEEETFSQKRKPQKKPLLIEEEIFPHRRGNLSSKKRKPFLRRGNLKRNLSSYKRKFFLIEEETFPQRRGNLSSEEETSKKPLLIEEEISPHRRGNLSSKKRKPFLRRGNLKRNLSA
jgi:hypothetical protein